MRKDMRIIIGGGFLLILGIILFYYGFSTIQNIEAYDDLGLPISEFLMTISEDTRNIYQIAQISEISGIVFLIIGICLLVGGILIPYQKITPSSKSYYVSETINKSPYVSREEAENILWERYTKREITKEQLEQMKKDLKEK